MKLNLSIFETNEFVTPPELATVLRTDPATVRGWCERRELRAVDTRTAGSKRPRWKISRQAWEDFAQIRSGNAPRKSARRRKQSADLSDYFGNEFEKN